MRIVIDGYNLLRHDQGLNRLACRDLRGAREELLRRLESYRKAKGHSIEIVFDAWGGDSLGLQEERYGGIRVIYSPAGQKADEVIMGRAKKLGEGAVVVSSDREIADFARARGCPVISAGEFEKKVMEAFYMQGAEAVEEDIEDPHPAKTKGPSRMLKKKDRKAGKALRKL